MYFHYFVSNSKVNSKAEATGASQAPTTAGKLATAEMFGAVGTPATSGSRASLLDRRPQMSSFFKNRINTEISSLKVRKSRPLIDFGRIIFAGSDNQVQ
jgi:hypothetical protein